MKTYSLSIQNKKEGLFINGNLCEVVRRNGIGVVKNYSAGIGHSAHPNIDETGSVRGMKELGYWRKSDVITRSGGFYYNTSSVVISDAIDALAYWVEQGNTLPTFPKDEFKTHSFTFSISI